MQNKRGFVFVETIVVISVVSIALISLFTLFYSVYNEEQKRLSFDNVEDLYATYFVKKYLEENNINRCFINYNSDDLFKEINMDLNNTVTYTIELRLDGHSGPLTFGPNSFSDGSIKTVSIAYNMNAPVLTYTETGKDIQICSLGTCIDGSDSVMLQSSFQRIKNGNHYDYIQPLTFTITVSSSDKCTILHDNDKTNGESFNTMKDKFNIKNLYLVTGDITNLKLNKAKNLLSANVIDYIKTMSKNSSGYYLVSEFENNNVASVKLTTDISNTTAFSILSANDSLMNATNTNNDGITYVHGNNQNNYVNFANKSWRILRINEDGSIRLILDKKLKPIKYDKIDDELNTFYNKLSSYSDYIVLSNYCEDNCNDNKCNNITTNNFSFACDNLAYYGQASWNEIMSTSSSLGNIKGQSRYQSFLSDFNDNFWIGAKSNKVPYYVTPSSDNSAGINYSYIYGPNIPINSTTAYIRPVISIKGSVVLTGNGSSKNPYQIKKE